MSRMLCDVNLSKSGEMFENNLIFVCLKFQVSKDLISTQREWKNLGDDRLLKYILKCH